MLFKTDVHKQFLLDHVMQVKTGSLLPVLHISAMYAFVDKIIQAQRDVIKFKATKRVFTIRPLKKAVKLQDIGVKVTAC